MNSHDIKLTFTSYIYDMVLTDTLYVDVFGACFQPLSVTVTLPVLFILGELGSQSDRKKEVITYRRNLIMRTGIHILLNIYIRRINYWLAS